MSLCWAEESLERPSFTDLRESLVSLQSRVLPTQLLTLEIDPTLVYYNVVLSTSTPEHSGSSKGRDGGTGNYWQRRDKVGKFMSLCTYISNNIDCSIVKLYENYCSAKICAHKGINKCCYCMHGFQWLP